MLEKHLSVYDPVAHRLILKGAEWDSESNILYIPRGINLNFLEKIFNCQAEMNYNCDEAEPISIQAKVPPRDNLQRNAIAFLIGAEKYQYTKKYSQLLLNLPTGTGKTYVMTTALQFIGERAIVIVPNDRLKQQAIETFLNMTNIREEHVKDIQGKSDIESLFSKRLPKYKVYVVCHSTLISYAKNYGWNTIDNLFKHLKIGVKIYDEAHMFFDNILKIDYHTNSKKTIYMTATFKRSDFSENILFNRCFNNVVKCDLTNDESIRKHVMYLAIHYNSKPSLDAQAHVITNRGFNKIRYTNHQIFQKAFFDSLEYVLRYFKSYEGKILILSTTIESVNVIQKFIEEKFPDKPVSSFHSKITGTERENAFSAEIICTTPKSAGVGVDIPGLRVVIMCESYSSEVEAEQVPGRLREYSKTDDTFYVELVDVGFPRVYRMWKSRLRVFEKKCKKLLTLDLS